MNKQNIETKKFFFPLSSCDFCLHVPTTIYDKFENLINQIFVLSSLTNFHVSWAEFPDYLYVTFSKKADTVHQLLFIHDKHMFFKHINIDWKKTNTNPIEALENFLKQIVESE